MQRYLITFYGNGGGTTYVDAASHQDAANAARAVWASAGNLQGGLVLTTYLDGVSVTFQCVWKNGAYRMVEGVL